jgi:hypothetical protein
MDAGMSATAAIMEMMLHTRRGVHYLFSGAPSSWRHASFEGMLTEGAFLVSADRCDGLVTRVDLQSQAGGTFRLANPWPGTGATLVLPSGERQSIAGETIEISTSAGETWSILPNPYP